MIKKLKKESVATIILIFAIIYLIQDILYPKDSIAILKIEGYIDSDYATSLVKALDSLEKDNLVKAIVLKTNSPGGQAESVHEIYYKILRVKEKKPIVASVDTLAASGAYYLASSTNYIFSKQSSEVGGVGVITELPEEIERPNIIVSGPFKAVEEEADLLRKVELLKKDFIETIKIGRGDKLKIDPTELTSGKLYIGSDAKELGLIDELGGIDDAISKTKELSGVKSYSIYEISSSSKELPLFIGQNVFSNTTSAPVFYYLYVKLGEKNE